MTTSPKVQQLELPHSLNLKFNEFLSYNTGYCSKIFTTQELELIKELVNETIIHYATFSITDDDVLRHNKEQHNKAVTEYQNQLDRIDLNRKKEPAKGYIYLVQNKFTKSLKIGFSKNPKNRVSQLNTSSEHPIEILYAIPGNTIQEVDLHRRFDIHHKRLEWFDYNEEIVEYFRNKTPRNNGSR